jgi:hypothetical protein
MLGVALHDAVAAEPERMAHEPSAAERTKMICGCSGHSFPKISGSHGMSFYAVGTFWLVPQNPRHKKACPSCQLAD